MKKINLQALIRYFETEKEKEKERKRRKKRMTRWESNAMFAQKEYGAYVDWEERFYNCPFCDEPIYEDDWEEDEYGEFLCPICEDCDRD